MQWNKKSQSKSTPWDRERRVITRFLLFPKELNGVVKWLEFAKIEQTYYKAEITATGGYDLFGDPAYNISGGKWYDDGWA